MRSPCGPVNTRNPTVRPGSHRPAFPPGAALDASRSLVCRGYDPCGRGAVAPNEGEDGMTDQRGRPVVQPGGLGPGVEQRQVDVGDVSLTVAEAGIGGRPLLLVHGFTGSKEDFGDWIDTFADEGWWVIAPDLRGHGDSEQP